MHSAVDHGYPTDFSIKVWPGLIVRNVSAEGNHEMKVHRRHRDHGYWECVWMDGPRVGSIYVRSESDILADAYAK